MSFLPKGVGSLLGGGLIGGLASGAIPPLAAVSPAAAILTRVGKKKPAEAPLNPNAPGAVTARQQSPGYGRGSSSLSV